MLLDIMLPGKSGRDVCTEIRKFSSKPIIMITAKGDVVHKVVCLELGADDFVVKPFDMNELFARIKAVLRRCNSHDEPGDSEDIKFENSENVFINGYNNKIKFKDLEQYLKMN